MKFTLSATALLALAAGALSAAVQPRQSPECAGYQSAGTLPHDTNWGGYFLCCDYEGPSGNNVSAWHFMGFLWSQGHTLTTFHGRLLRIAVTATVSTLVAGHRLASNSRRV